jgi:hypothetical protein
MMPARGGSAFGGKYKIDDIRLLQSGDLRFLNQF